MPLGLGGKSWEGREERERETNDRIKSINELKSRGGGIPSRLSFLLTLKQSGFSTIFNNVLEKRKAYLCAWETT